MHLVYRSRYTPQVHLSSQRHTHEVPLLVCIHIKLHTGTYTFTLVHLCTYMHIHILYVCQGDAQVHMHVQYT